MAAVQRAMRLLDLLAAEPRGLGVNELARAVGVTPSTASRLLGTLRAGRLVERDAEGRHRLGMHLVALGEAVLARLDVRAVARSWLDHLVAQTGVTATISVPGGWEAVTVDFVPAESSVVSMAQLGRPSAAHATATGKVMLAFGPRGIPPDLRLVAYTPKTIVDRGALEAEIERVRERGWSEGVGEREPDLHGLAVPVYGRGAELVAILGLQGPATRLDDARRVEVLPPLREAARELSRALGGQLQG